MSASNIDHTFPIFPDDIPTHPLLVVDYELIKAGNTDEIEKLWKAGKELGFWYLKNHGVDEEARAMFDMGAETMRLPLDDKMKFEQQDGGMSFGYKAKGANAVDESGKPDTVEFINIAKDDAFAWPKIARRAYPSTVNERMESTISPFIRKSNDVNLTLLGVFNDKLGLPEGTLAQLHSVEEFSGSESRCIRSPYNPNATEADRALGAHTDFGSLSFLHNRLSGLQVLVPGTTQWQYIKPIPGHAICNLGDSMVIFSGGILRSNLHRVVPPPGAQPGSDRWSLVYFSRPGDSVVLRALKEESAIIAAAIIDNALKDASVNVKYDTGSTAGEWFSRRIKYQRLNNRTGPESWLASRGTEHQPLVA